LTSGNAIFLVEVAEMNKYAATNPCPKCDAVGALVEHHKAGFCREDPKGPEHMHRWCQVCKYEWYEEPIS
jgi:hypothetical protein